MGATNIGYIKERKQFTTQRQQQQHHSLVLQIQDISKNESNSQQPIPLHLKIQRCYKYRIYQRTKAIHNQRVYVHVVSSGATNIGYIKERKQFTTAEGNSPIIREVLQIQDISKNESNSQLENKSKTPAQRCYKYRIYQRTKAIHNQEWLEKNARGGATNIGYIKERKQFTTETAVNISKQWCYKYRIYQRTKAIHNRLLCRFTRNSGATNIGYIKERKQFTTNG